MIECKTIYCTFQGKPGRLFLVKGPDAKKFIRYLHWMVYKTHWDDLPTYDPNS